MLSAVHAEPICHPSRSPPHPLGLTLSPSRLGRTRGEVSIAQTLADSGYATTMWGEWQVGSDPEQRRRWTSALTRRSGLHGPLTS